MDKESGDVKDDKTETNVEESDEEINLDDSDNGDKLDAKDDSNEEDDPESKGDEGSLDDEGKSETTHDELIEELCSLCQLKDVESKAEFCCTDCGKSLCFKCSDFHQITDNHSVEVMALSSRGQCGQHDSQLLSYLCLTCIERICSSCLTQHEEHKVNKLQPGLCLLREHVDNTITELLHLHKALDFKVKTLQVDVIKYEADDMAVSTSIGLVPVNTAEEQNQLKDLVIQNVKSTLCNMTNTKERSLKLLDELHGSIYLSEESFLEKYSSMKQEMNSICHDMKNDLQELHLSSMVDLNEKAASKGRDQIHIFLANSLDDPELNKPELVLSRNKIRNIDFVHTTQLCVIDKNSVLLVEQGLNHVTRLNKWAELMSYQFSHGVGICGVDLYRHYLFMAHKSGITRVPLSISYEDRHTYCDLAGLLPAQANINKLLSWDSDSVILSDSRLGQLYLYNIQNNTVQTIIKGLLKPSFMSSTVTDTGKILIVTDEAANCVKIYTNKWEEVTCIPKKETKDNLFNLPCATVVTPDNLLLIADSNNHRVSLYNLEGIFIRHILSHDDVTWPCGLAYIQPYLWLTEYSLLELHTQVKCFKIG